MNELDVHCKCIRCREYGHRSRDGWPIAEPVLTRADYRACGGGEIFLSYEDAGETLFGLLRLRVDAGLASIRELHVFGSEVSLGQKQERAAQHQGLGVRLLQEAERIALEEFHARSLSILSGVGAREYYRQLGYRQVGAYMVKEPACSS